MVPWTTCQPAKEHLDFSAGFAEYISVTHRYNDRYKANAKHAMRSNNTHSSILDVQG